MVDEYSATLDREDVMQALFTDDVVFSNLKSLEIKIGVKEPKDQKKMDSKFVRLDFGRFKRDLFDSMLAIQRSHNHLCRLLESGTATGTGVAFRLVTASTASRENVKFQINKPEFH